MKSAKYFYLILIAAVAITSFDERTEPFLERIKAGLQQFTQVHPEEKVYLQLDKPFYKPGDDIWFNTFLVDASTHKPSFISDVVYVELKDPKGNAVSKLELFVKDGTAKGDFNIGESAAGGLYTLTAYTRWMQNAGEETYFKKEIQVQKVITPRMLIKLDFEKEAYGRGDEVLANLTINNLKNQAMNDATVKSTIKIDGQAIHEFELKSNAEGKVQVKFNLPGELKTTDGILQIIISHSGQQESITRSIPIVLNRIALQFFPEGGDLVMDAECAVAFKATNEFNKGADVSGVIVDDNNNVITSFESFHMGMGAFRFKPQENKVYRARITRPLGNEQTFILPSAQTSGYGLSIAYDQNKELTCTIQSAINAEVFLTGQSHGQMYYAEKLVVKKGSNTISVPASKFPAGIAMFTLFNSEGLEESERLVFLNRNKTLNIAITTDKKDYEPRDKVELNIRTTDETGKAVPAKLSVAVADDQLLSFADDKQDNILSWLLLSSEVKGKIQEPSFYFDPKEPKAEQALNYLLMTHGWRRFTWKDVLKNDKAITYLPENSSSISGLAVDRLNKPGHPDPTDVILLELSNRRRIAKVKTRSDGQFMFKNVDASVPLLLLTKLPYQLKTAPNKNTGMGASTNTTKKIYERQELAKNVIANPTVDDVNAVMTPAAIISADGEMDMMLDTDVAQLSEVIVTGYGVQERRDVTGSIAHVGINPIENLNGNGSLEALLQGRVAGIQVQQQNANPSASSSIRIRGTSSLTINRGEPLYVIDGLPISGNLNQNFANGSIINPEDISSIHVMQTPEASAIYGSAAANGAIVITTKSNIFYHSFQSRPRKPKYSSLLVNPRMFSVTREFFRDVPSKQSLDERKDFNTTVYWNHTVVTDKEGKATLSFYNNDATSAFRITAEGISNNGYVGRQEEVYSTQLPFSLDTKIPEFMGFEDTVSMPVMIKNNSRSALTGNLALTIPDGLQALDATNVVVQVDAQQTKTHRIRLISRSQIGKFPVHIRLEGNKHQDEVRHFIDVHPIGFEVRMSFSGKEKDRNISFDIQDMEKGSLKADVTVYTDVLSDLFSGAESILREPHGCFEQVSSSTFPNILALQFMKQSGQLQPGAEKIAMSYIKNGYKKLAAYEIPGGGFEWFGHPPAHEGLTAYGLIQFHEMSKVFDGVSESMVNRTREWILSRRKGDGTFRQNAGKYGFSGAAGSVNNAYLVYALAETGTTAIEKEYQHSLAEAQSSKDLYRMALMANAAHSLGKTTDYQNLIRYFSEQQEKVGFEKLRVDHSIVRSYGNSLTNETVALWAVALMKSPHSNLDLVNSCIRFIVSGRAHGMFGSTQATALSLKALTEYARYARTTRGAGEIHVAMNNAITDSQSFSAETRDKITLEKFASHLQEGSNNIQLKFFGPGSLPYSVNVQWKTKTPVSSKDCKVSVKTTLMQSSMKVNETVRMTAVIQNTSHEGIPMSVALIGIPGGLSVQPWQLKELKEKGVFDFYEVLGDKLAIYYRELEPDAIRTINLDLKAEVPGTYTAVASSAYLYYTDEYKFWARGSRISINP